MGTCINNQSCASDLNGGPSNINSDVEDVILILGKEEVVAAAITEAGIPPPPDGGWGWVIVAASFLCFLIMDGITSTFGILLPQIVGTFHKDDASVGRSQVAWAGSLLTGFSLCIGPIVSALINRFGCRCICIAGSLIAALGFFGASFSTNLTTLILSYGLVGGVGVGLVYLPASVAVGYYFESKRALATGIAMSGSGIGNIAFAPVMMALGDVADWRTVCLAYGSLVASLIFAGALMRPLEIKIEPLDAEKGAGISNEKTPLRGDAGYFIVQLADGTIEKHAKILVDVYPVVHSGECLSQLLPPEVEELSPINEDSITSISSTQASLGDVNVKAGKTKKTFTIRAIPSSGLNLSKSAQSKPRNGVEPSSDNQEFECILSTELSPFSKTEPKLIIRPFSRKDILYHGSIHKLPEYRSRDLIAYRRSVLALAKKKEESRRWFGAFGDALSQMLDFSLLKNPIFLFIAGSSLFAMLGFFVPIVYVIDFSVQQGITKESGAIFISIIGGTSVVGRLLFGLLSDLPSVNSLTVYNCCLLIMGLSTCSLPFCFNFYLIAGVYAVFGIAASGFMTLSSIVLVQLLGLENLTNAFGLLIFFRGLSGVLGSPLSGAIFDSTGSYRIPFYLAGGFLIISSLISAIIPLISRFAPPKCGVEPKMILIGALLEEDNEEEVPAVQSGSERRSVRP